MHAEAVIMSGFPACASAGAARKRQSAMMLIRALFFFFQAEDGIRDLTVTGVQTCALPIYIPDIDAGVLDLRIITRQAWDAIALANAEQPFIFKHGGVPVWISRDDEGRATLAELTQTHIRHILARVAEFFVIKVKKIVQADGGELQTKVRQVVLPPNHV